MTAGEPCGEGSAAEADEVARADHEGAGVNEDDSPSEDDDRASTAAEPCGEDSAAPTAKALALANGLTPTEAAALS